MILALNRQQLLSGSKLIYLGIFLFFLASCGSSKKTTKRTPLPDNRVEKEQVKTLPKIDTIDWTIVDPNINPPINDNTESELINRKLSYNLALLLPLDVASFTFNEDDANEVNSRQRFLNFYAGVKMALKDLEKEGYKFKIEVFDSEARGGVEAILGKPYLNNCDAIIGPYSKVNLEKVVAFGKRKEIPVISPWRASSTMTKDNPYYIQLRPNLDAYFYSIVKYVKENFEQEQCYLVGRDSDRDRRLFEFFQAYNKEIGGEFEPDFNSFIVNEDSLSMGDTAFDIDPLLTEELVYIFPQFSFSNDESFVYSCLRRLNVEKGQNNIHVIGMPIMIDSEQIGFNFYRNLNMKVSRSKYVDPTSEEVKQFQKDYYDQYFDLPEDDALEGYDMIRFVITNLAEYGTNFQYFLNKDRSRYLQMAFDIQKKSADKAENDDFDYFENLSLDIVEFQDGQFKRKE